MEISLIDLKSGERGVVKEVQGGHGMVMHLGALGIRKGKSITVITRHPFGGPLVIEVDGREITLGRGLATRIVLEKAG